MPLHPAEATQPQVELPRDPRPPLRMPPRAVQQPRRLRVHAPTGVVHVHAVPPHRHAAQLLPQAHDPHFTSGEHTSPGHIVPGSVRVGRNVGDSPARKKAQATAVIQRKPKPVGCTFVVRHRTETRTHNVPVPTRIQQQEIVADNTRDRNTRPMPETDAEVRVAGVGGHVIGNGTRHRRRGVAVRQERPDLTAQVQRQSREHVALAEVHGPDAGDRGRSRAFAGRATGEGVLTQAHSARSSK